jgi:hypothetical protein
MHENGSVTDDDVKLLQQTREEVKLSNRGKTKYVQSQKTHKRCCVCHCRQVVLGGMCSKIISSPPKQKWRNHEAPRLSWINDVNYTKLNTLALRQRGAGDIIFATCVIHTLSLQ